MSKNSGRKSVSLDDLRKMYGLKPIIRQTKNKEKLKAQRNAFNKKHICSACGSELILIEETNVMCCKNPDCKGIKYQTMNKETGELEDQYKVSCHMLDRTGATIANNIFKN